MRIEFNDIKELYQELQEGYELYKKLIARINSLNVEAKEHMSMEEAKEYASQLSELLNLYASVRQIRDYLLRKVSEEYEKISTAFNGVSTITNGVKISILVNEIVIEKDGEFLFRLFPDSNIFYDVDDIFQP